MKPNGKIHALAVDTDIERLVLGSIMLSGGSLMDGMRSTMEISDFGDQRHQQIWAAACDVYDAGGKLDYVVVTTELMKRDQLRDTAISYMVSLTEGLPQIPCLDQYIRILKDKALTRRISAVTNNLYQRSLAGIESGDELREAMNRAMTEVSDTAPADRRPISTADMVAEHGIDGLLNPKRVEGVRLPWDRLNGVLHGLRGGQIIVLAGDTGRGKSSAALQVTTHAMRQGKGVLYWTLEMPPRALFQRMITQMTGTDRRNASPTFEQREAERAAVGFLHDNPVYFDRSSRTVSGFCAAVRQVKQKTRLGLVVVDYLQLIRASGHAESRTREVGENSRSLKLAAMDFDVPFMVLSQFTRPKEGQRPNIHNLKESGDIENDADVILIIMSGELSPTESSASSIYVGKQREGPAGFDIPMIWHPQSQSFQSVED